MGCHRAIFSALALALSVSLAQAQETNGGGGGFTLGSTSIASGSTTTTITGMASFGITAPTANTTPFTISGYSLTAANTQPLVRLSGTLNTSGSPDVVSIAITETAAGASRSFFSIYGGAAGTTKYFAFDTFSNGGTVYPRLTQTGGSIGIGEYNQTVIFAGDATHSGGYVNFGGLGIAADRVMGFSSNANAIASGQDTAFSRLAAASMALGNGTAGDFSGSLKLTTITMDGVIHTKGYAIASLPAGTAGDIAYVTDQQTACPALGGTFTAGGAVKCPAFYNGTAWIHE